MEEKKLKSSYSLRPKVDEPEAIKEFLRIQSNFSEAVRYLIEKEISQNGIRDLSEHIPMKRNTEHLNRFINQDKNEVLLQYGDELKRNIQTNDNVIRNNTHKYIEKQDIEKKDNTIQDNTIYDSNKSNSIQDKDIVSNDTMSYKKEVNEIATTSSKEEYPIEPDSKSKYPLINKNFTKLQTRGEETPKDDDIPDCYE